MYEIFREKPGVGEEDQCNVTAASSLGRVVTRSVGNMPIFNYKCSIKVN